MAMETHKFTVNHVLTIINHMLTIINHMLTIINNILTIIYGNLQMGNLQIWSKFMEHHRILNGYINYFPSLCYSLSSVIIIHYHPFWLIISPPFLPEAPNRRCRARRRWCLATKARRSRTRRRANWDLPALDGPGAPWEKHRKTHVRTMAKSWFHVENGWLNPAKMVDFTWFKQETWWLVGDLW